jgi:hypothetical protein
MAASLIQTFLRRFAPLSPLLLSCSPMPSDALPDSAEVRVANPIAWPGGQLTLVSGAFSGRSDLPEVRLDALMLAVTRVNDSTVTADLPDSSGDFPLHLHYRNGDRTGSVTLVGFTGRTETAPLSGWAVPETPGSPVVIAAADSNLVRLDVRTGSVLPLAIPHSGNCAISPGPSYRDSAVVAQAMAGTTCALPKLWTLAPSIAAVDSVALSIPADRVWVELAPSTWLNTSHHDLTIQQDGQVILREQLEEADRVVFSPDHSRALVTTTNAPYQVPVLLSAGGTIAYRLPLVSAQGAAFTPDGDTLFVAGYRAFSPEQIRLVAVRAATGGVLADTSYSGAELLAIVLDPDAPLLYGVELSQGTPFLQPGLLVFDRRTLGLVGRIRPPTDTTCTSPFCGQIGVAVDPNARRLYAFEIAGWTSASPDWPTSVFSFDLVPATQTPEVLSPGP